MGWRTKETKEKGETGKEKRERGKRKREVHSDGWAAGERRANRRSKRRKTGGPKGGMRNKKTNFTAGE